MERGCRVSGPFLSFRERYPATYMTDIGPKGEKLSSLHSRADSTGNSRRSKHQISSWRGDFEFLHRTRRTSALRTDGGLHQGVVVEEVMGVHMVDPISGDFSLGCSGDWVDKGERVHPVKSVAIAGNLFELFRKVKGVGEDLRFFGSVGSPSLLVEGLVISGN